MCYAFILLKDEGTFFPCFTYKVNNTVHLHHGFWSATTNLNVHVIMLQLHVSHSVTYTHDHVTIASESPQELKKCLS